MTTAVNTYGKTKYTSRILDGRLATGDLCKATYLNASKDLSTSLKSKHDVHSE